MPTETCTCWRYVLKCIVWPQRKMCFFAWNLIVVLMFSSFFFHIARTPFPCRFKPTPSGHLHSEEICISRNKEKLGYIDLEIISAVVQSQSSQCRVKSLRLLISFVPLLTNCLYMKLLVNNYWCCMPEMMFHIITTFCYLIACNILAWGEGGT